MKSSWLGFLALAMLPCGALCGVFPVADQTVCTLDLAEVSVTNKSDAVFDLGAGATLKLVNANAAAVNHLLRANLVATNGPAALDLSELPADKDVQVSGALVSFGAGSLSVQGRDTLLFGEQKDPTTFNYPLLDAPNLAFETAGGAGLVLTNLVALRNAPAGFTVADGALLALRGTNSLERTPAWDASAGEHGTLTLSTFDVMLLNDTAVPPRAQINVMPGRTLHLKPCRSNPSDYFKWAGIAGSNSNDVDIAAGGTVHIVSQNDYALYGALTGAGTVHADSIRSTLGSGNNGSRLTNIAGFSGDFVLGVNATFNPDITNCVLRLAGFGGDYHIPSVTYDYPMATLAFESSTPATVTIDRLSGVAATTDILSANTNVTFNIASAEGKFGLSGTGHANIIKLKDNFQLTLGAGTDTALGTVGLSGRIDLIPVTHGENCVRISQMDGADEQTLPPIAADAPMTLCLNGNFRTTLLSPLVSLQITGENRALRLAAPTGISIAPRLWLDASRSASMQTLKNGGVEQAYTNGFRLIDEWHDRRPEQTTYYTRNDRANLPADPTVYNYVYPYVVTNGLNGLDYVSMGEAHVTTGVEARRVDFFKEGQIADLQDIKYAIMVFGSQLGGGSAILGSQYSAFSRPGRTLQDPIISTNRFDIWVDGVKAEQPTNTYFNGAWQIISIKVANASLLGIGRKNTDTANATIGGQNYAEVLFFSEDLTDAQRQEVELYLATKWGLAGQYATHAAARIDGDGTLTLESRQEVEGSFSGTIDLNGQTLVVSGKRPVPTAAELPSEGRELWFDPDFDGALQMSVNTTDRPLSVNCIYPRDATGLVKTNGTRYLVSTVSSFNNQWLKVPNDRRPSLSRRAHGTGSVRNWIDYANLYAGDSLNNAMRVQQLPWNGEGAVDTTKDVLCTYRTGFMALDTARGGGSVLLDNISGLGEILPRPANSVTDPIWPTTREGKSAGAAGRALAQGMARLDGQPVNPVTRGFSGRAEVFTFQATANLSTKIYLGNIHGDGLTVPNGEIIGETLYYSTALSETQCADVEAYLMRKWLGRLPAGYSDLRAATVTGAGTLVAATAAALPKLGDGFAGDVRLTGADFAFTIDANATPSVPNALSLACPLTLPAAATVRVDFAAKAQPGVYPLVTAAPLDGATDWTLQTSGELGTAKAHLIQTATSLALEVLGSGTFVIIR